MLPSGSELPNGLQPLSFKGGVVAIVLRCVNQRDIVARVYTSLFSFFYRCVVFRILEKICIVARLK